MVIHVESPDDRQAGPLSFMSLSPCGQTYSSTQGGRGGRARVLVSRLYKYVFVCEGGAAGRRQWIRDSVQVFQSVSTSGTKTL